MLETKRVYLERVGEIEFYYNHLQREENTAESILFRVQKANLILMLYNLVESTVSNSIKAIREAIHNNVDVNFDCLKAEIKKEILIDLKNATISAENFIKESRVISNDIIKLSFSIRAISNGNIDREAITRLSQVYGFNISNSDFEETGHGNTLEAIRKKRNDLAHGTYSFSQVGKEYSLQDLESLKNKTVKYLGNIVSNIESYLDTQSYKS